MEEYARALHYARRRNAEVSPNSTALFNRHKSGRLSVSSDLRWRGASDEDHRSDGVRENYLNGIRYPTRNDSNDAAASGYNDVFGEPPNYSFRKAISQPLIPMTTYDEIFRLPSKVLSSSRLSSLPVFDPPTYGNASVYNISPHTRESAAALRYEDIFGGGLPTGPTHVGIRDLFERFETKSTPSSRSASRLQSPFKATGRFLQDADNEKSPQNESIRRHRAPMRLHSFNSALREKDEKLQERERKFSHLSSTRPRNDGNVHFHSESNLGKAHHRMSQNGAMETNFKGKFPQQSFEAPDAFFSQTPNPMLDREASGGTQHSNLPMLKVSTMSDEILETKGGGALRSTFKESTHQKHFEKLRTELLSPEAHENKLYRDDTMSPPMVRLDAVQETWLSVEEWKLKTHTTPSPPPARLPPTMYGQRGSVAARASRSRLANKISEARWNEQTGFTGEDQDASSCELDGAFLHPSVSTSTSFVHLQQNEDNTSPHIISETEYAKHADAARENEDEYASVDTSISSVGGEPTNILNAGIPDTVAPGKMQRTEESLIGVALAGAFEQRETQQLCRDNGVAQEAEGLAGKVEQEKVREAPAKGNHTREKRPESDKDEKLSERERATVKMQTKRPESAGDGIHVKEAKEFLKVKETKAMGETFSKNNNDEGKIGTYRMAKVDIKLEVKQKAAVVALEKREREVREGRERERATRERELERQREREKDRMDLERTATERAAVEEAQAKLERPAADGRERAERPAAEQKVHPMSNRVQRGSIEKVAAKACTKADTKRVTKERTQAEGHGNSTRRTTLQRTTSGVNEKGETAAAGNFTSSGGHCKKNIISGSEVYYKTSIRASSAQRHRHDMQDFVFKKKPTKEEITTGSLGGSTNTTSVIPENITSSKVPNVEGEATKRRLAQLERHERTLERVAKALSEKNQRDLEVQQEKAERHRFAGMLDAEIKRWLAGKQGNLRALLSTLQFILWQESGWQPVPLTDLISPAAVKKAYRKATLCIHPDKVQQKGASIQQKYIAEKVFDLLKEAWNKLNLEEQC